MAEVTRKREVTISETKTVASGSTATFLANKESFVEAWAEFPIQGTQNASSTAVDTTNVSTLESAITDGDLSNLCYNNSSAGSLNKELPGVDLGASVSVDQAKVYWWNISYYATTFRIEYSADASAWSTAGTFSGVFPGSGVSQDVYFPAQTARYWRILCVVGQNSTWCVASELQLFSPSGTFIPTVTADLQISTTENVSGQVEITNNTGQSLNIITYYNA